MTSRRMAALLALAATVSLPSHARADQRAVNVAVERRSGEKTRGPVTIRLTGVNVVRYDVLAGVSVTFTAGPDLRVPFIPPIPAVAAGTPTPPAGEKGSSVTVDVGSLLTRLGQLERDRITN